MKRAVAFFVAVTLAGAISAQNQPSISFSPVSCLRAGEMPVLQMRVNGEGELRGYFRKANTTDWCSVAGDNRGALSSVTFPKFSDNDEIEFFFLLLDGKRVVARTPQVYRAKASMNCQAPWARHVVMVMIDCASNGQNSMPASMGAGFSLNDNIISRRMPVPTPDQPLATVRGLQ